MEPTDRALSVPYGAGGWRVHSGVAGTGVHGYGGEAHVSAGTADGAGFPDRRSPALAAAFRTSGAFLRDVPDAAPIVRDGDVWLRVPVVSAGSAGGRNLARLPARHRDDVSTHNRLEAIGVPGADAGFHQHQRACAAYR